MFLGDFFAPALRRKSGAGSGAGREAARGKMLGVKKLPARYERKLLPCIDGILVTPNSRLIQSRIVFPIAAASGRSAAW